MHAIMVSMGSMGDTLPFVVMGRALRERGHRVTLIGNAHFIDMFRNEGFDYAESLSEQQYDAFLNGQINWSGVRALKEMGELVKDQIPKIYQLIAERYVPGETVVAAQGYAFGARIAQEKLGVPLATVHLQPMWFRSIYDPIGLPDWFPRWFPAMLDRLVDRILDRGMGPTTNGFRGELGLPPVKFIMKHWWNSPQLVMGMFPDWFNPPQPDWPPQSRLPGFPLYRLRENEFVSPELEDFLSSGDPPILFMQSSVTNEAHRYFEVSVEVAKRLRRRAILLTPHPEQIPDRLPPEIVYFKYIPLDSVLHRCALHVHHGGIGTIAHTLAAGIPQLTVPMVYDQPDNAQRLLRLKASGFLKRSQYRVRRAARVIAELLDSPEVAARCRIYAEKCRQTDGVAAACQLLEQLVEQTAAGRSVNEPLAVS
jgi:rhamnosyltransferase subunit B